MVDYCDRAVVVDGTFRRSVPLTSDPYIMLAVHDHLIHIKNIIFPDALDYLWSSSISRHPQTLRAVTISGGHPLKVHLSAYNLRTGKTARLPWRRRMRSIMGAEGFTTLRAIEPQQG